MAPLIAVGVHQGSSPPTLEGAPLPLEYLRGLEQRLPGKVQREVWQVGAALHRVP